MYKIVILVVLMSTLPAAAGDVQERVNYHLKSLQTKIEHNESQSRLNAIRSQQTDTPIETSTPHNPHYGVGDLAPAHESPYETQDVPRVLTPREEIEQETALMKGRHVSNENSAKNATDSEEEKRRFIEQFKENAAKRGIRVEVDPVTLEVRQVR